MRILHWGTPFVVGVVILIGCGATKITSNEALKF